jgi:hypothetical protein
VDSIEWLASTWLPAEIIEAQKRLIEGHAEGITLPRLQSQPKTVFSSSTSLT